MISLYIIFAICLFFVGHCADRGVWITRFDIGVIVCNGMMWNKHEHQQWYNRQHQLHAKSDYHRLYQFIDVYLLIYAPT